MSKVLMGRVLGQALVDAGVISRLARHIIIEIPLEGAVTIHLEELADERLVEILPAKAVGAKVVDHAKPDDPDDPGPLLNWAP